MQDQLVGLEVAQLAKEKGFFQYCSKRYNKGKLESSPFPPIRFKKDGTPVKVDSNQVYAPTQSLLQKWLRENHNLIINVQSIYMDVEASNISGYIYWLTYRSVESRTFISYEEALENGLLYALKLIK